MSAMFANGNVEGTHHSAYPPLLCRWLYYENATHQLRNATKTQKINFTKAQEKDLEKRMA